MKILEDAEVRNDNSEFICQETDRTFCVNSVTTLVYFGNSNLALFAAFRHSWDAITSTPHLLHN